MLDQSIVFKAERALTDTGEIVYKMKRRQQRKATVSNTI